MGANSTPTGRNFSCQVAVILFVLFRVFLKANENLVKKIVSSNNLITLKVGDGNIINLVAN